MLVHFFPRSDKAAMPPIRQISNAARRRRWLASTHHQATAIQSEVSCGVDVEVGNAVEQRLSGRFESRSRHEVGVGRNQ